MYIAYDSFAAYILLWEFLRKTNLKMENININLHCEIVIHLKTSKMRGEGSFEHQKQMLKLMDQKIQ